MKFRRSIFAKTNIYKDERISHKNTVALRPLIGLKAEKIFKVIGKKVKKNITKDSPIFLDDLKK